MGKKSNSLNWSWTSNAGAKWATTLCLMTVCSLFLSLTFTNGNWNTPQTVTVTGVKDNDKNNEQTVIIHSVTSPTSSSEYGNVGMSNVRVDVIDTTAEDNYEDN